MSIHLVQQRGVTGILYQQFSLLDDEIEEGFELGKTEVFGTLRQILREKVQERGHIGWCQCFYLMVYIELLKELEHIFISSDYPCFESGSLVIPV